MHDAATEQALSRATADVLEKMFFTGFANESAAVPEPGARIVVRLAFTGERRGVLMLGVPHGAARTLAADFLGIDTGDELGDDRIHEVVCELANMVCGDTLSALEKGALCLSCPEILPAVDWNPLPDASSRSFDLGGGILTVALTFEDDDHA